MNMIGIDIGSVSVKLVILGPKRDVLFQTWQRSNGQPLATLKQVLEQALKEIGDVELRSGRVTGSGQTLVADALGLNRMNEIQAHAVAAWTCHPEAKSVIDIGGQDSKFIKVGHRADGSPFVEEHAFNDLCAAGTGAFLDQMAERLGLGIDEFSQLAASSLRAARIAGRCAVFAKSDIIHLRQRACPVDEIACGLCFALVRTYLASVCHGKRPEPPIVFQGGVAQNEGVLRAFAEVLSLDRSAIIRPTYFRVMGALGAALSAENDSPLNVKLSLLVERLSSRKPFMDKEAELPPLNATLVTYDVVQTNNNTATEIFIGLDVGSVTTKAVALAKDGQVIAWAYKQTAGEPVKAIHSTLEDLRSQLPHGFRVMRAVTTGSGRHLALHLTQADEAVDEITAQARYAAFFCPQVDTVFEIGGQDSKYIRIEKGRVKRFQMNRACAAGTGAFLEEQAHRLGVAVSEFSERALAAKRPALMAHRCTVFMDIDTVHYAQRGRPKEDICAGLAYAVARNYLEKVVGSRPIGEHIVFQGGVAKNASVHAAIQKLVGREILVPPYPHLSGAIGAALIAREMAGNRTVALRGLEKPFGEVKTRTFDCKACENFCEVQEVKVQGSASRRAWFGSVCGRFERGEAEPIGPEDAFAERERLLRECAKSGQRGDKHRGPVAFPMALTMHEHLPFWQTFFEYLGFEVILSGSTNREITGFGLSSVPAEFCQPMKVLFGHVQALKQSGAERIFIPHLRLFAAPGEQKEWYACPYTQAAPYVVRATFGGLDVLTLEFPSRLERAHFLRTTAQVLGASEREVGQALDAAFSGLGRFRRACKERGKALLETLERSGRIGAVLLGRPYNTADRHLNLHVARRLHQLGLEPVPLDFLPLDEEVLPEYWRRVRWGQGRTLLKAARILRRNPHLVGVIVTNFGCGPDAFVDQYLEHILHDTPHIVLEFDDHQAEAGVLTRLEAFARTVAVSSNRVSSLPADEFAVFPGKAKRSLKELEYWIPYFSDHAHAFVGALRSVGCTAILLPPTDDDSFQIGQRFAYGRECHPYVALLGDFLRAAQRPDFDPEKACFYGPSYLGPCLLPQYPNAMDLVFRRLGLGNVTLLNLGDPPAMAELGKGYIVRLVLGLLAIDRLHKWKVETEGYEVEAGEVARVHAQNLKAIEDGLANGRFFAALRECVERFQGIKLRPDAGKRPKIGIAGDIYTRINPHANDRLYEKLRARGFEVWTSCMMIDLSWLGVEQWSEVLWRQGKRVESLLGRGLWPLIRAIRHIVNRHFPPNIRTPEEGHFPEVKAGCERYCSYWIDRLLALNINRFREFCQAGASGVLNVMCHNCMLGTITQALLPALRADLPQLEATTLIYEDLRSTATTNRLEAFLEQVLAKRR